MRLGLILLFLLIAACTGHSADSPVNATKAQEGARSFSEMFAQQRVCGPAWQRIYKQWIRDGGGIKNSMAETRKQIAKDQKSALARIIRKVWSSPNAPGITESRLWKWPIDENKSRRLSSLFGDASEGYVPHECATLIWLPAIIWDDDLRLLNSKPGEFRIPSEAPSDVGWDSNTMPNWILYWLLVKIPK
ncbi:MAG: hypothetical protein ACRES7_11300 [Gammaproteobacteria bacterium]